MEQFGKYALIRKIGTGGMAEVFLARAPVAQGLNKTLVIKKIHTAYARSRQFVTNCSIVPMPVVMFCSNWLRMQTLN